MARFSSTQEAFVWFQEQRTANPDNDVLELYMEASNGLDTPAQQEQFRTFVRRAKEEKASKR